MQPADNSWQEDSAKDGELDDSGGVTDAEPADLGPYDSFPSGTDTPDSGLLDSSPSRGEPHDSSLPGDVDTIQAEPLDAGTNEIDGEVDAVGTADAQYQDAREGDGNDTFGTIMTLRSSGRLVGAALSTTHFDDAEYLSLAAREFNYVTPENEMKWVSTEPTRGQFAFASGDAIVAFAEQHDMKVKGHTLVWHSQLPNWLNDLQSEVEVRDVMVQHVREVTSHYRGRVVAWDVVNEAISDAVGNPLRDSLFYRYLGNSYIDEAFRVAHEADPEALLFYNDYGIDGLGGKSTAAYALMQDLLARGTPIHGIGLQMHLRVGSPPFDVVANIKRFADLGLLVAITELDVITCATSEDRDARLASQGSMFHDVAAACLTNSKCHGVSVWGVIDKYSWLARSCTTSTSAWPLAFDDNYQRKPAWQGLMDALLGK